MRLRTGTSRVKQRWRSGDEADLRPSLLLMKRREEENEEENTSEVVRIVDEEAAPDIFCCDTR